MCGIEHGEAVFWNPDNNVVQCHKCGNIWVPEEETAEDGGA